MPVWISEGSEQAGGGTDMMEIDLSVTYLVVDLLG